MVDASRFLISQHWRHIRTNNFVPIGYRTISNNVIWRFRRAKSAARKLNTKCPTFPKFGEYTMKTRQDYLNGDISFQDYYRQFATASVKAMVKSFMADRNVDIAADPHLNTIPLHLWDRLADRMPQDSLRLIQAANGTGGISLSDKVCTLKQAASDMHTCEDCNTRPGRLLAAYPARLCDECATVREAVGS